MPHGGSRRRGRAAASAGRDFDDGDSRTSKRVAIVNGAAARKYFGGQSPLGKTFRIDQQGQFSDPVLVVGMVEDAKNRSLRATDEPIVYLPAAQDTDGWARPTFVVRSDLAPAAVSDAIAAVAARVDPRMSLRFTTLSDQVARTVSRERALALLSASFGGLAFLLAMIGILLSIPIAKRLGLLLLLNIIIRECLWIEHAILLLLLLVRIIK